MRDTSQNRPVQTYSQDAERLGTQLARSNSRPQIRSEIAVAVRAQAKEIADFIIEKSTSSRLRKR